MQAQICQLMVAERLKFQHGAVVSAVLRILFDQRPDNCGDAISYASRVGVSYIYVCHRFVLSLRFLVVCLSVDINVGNCCVCTID